MKTNIRSGDFWPSLYIRNSGILDPKLKTGLRTEAHNLFKKSQTRLQLLQKHRNYIVHFLLKSLKNRETFVDRSEWVIKFSAPQKQ